MYKFKNFSEGANRSVSAAVDIAQKMGYLTVGTEHLLLGIMTQGKNDTNDLMEKEGISFASVYNAVTAVMGTGVQSSLTHEDLSFNAVEVLKQASVFARQNGKWSVDVSEIVMSMMNNEICIARQLILIYINDDKKFKEGLMQISCKFGTLQFQSSEKEKERLEGLENQLRKNVIGQDKAVKAVADAIKKWRVGISAQERPISSFLFLGPTGVGKTQTCKELSKCMYGDEKAIVRIDCSEYGEKNDITKLIGAPPGYAGYEDAGKLEKELLSKPYSVVLFDEIEKAHSDFTNILLQILDDGFVTVSSGKKVSFKNAIVIMTSNIGARQITSKTTELGFAKNSIGKEKINQEIVEKAVKERFSPEFIGRIDQIITFDPLNRKSVLKITEIMINQLKERLENLHITFDCSPAIAKYISERGYSQNYGARPLRKEISNTLENFLSEGIFNGKIKTNDKIYLDLEDNKVVMK